MSVDPRQPVRLKDLAEAIYLARVLGALELALEVKPMRSPRGLAAKKEIGGRLRALVERLGFDPDLLTEILATVHADESKLRAERRGQPRGGSRLH